MNTAVRHSLVAESQSRQFEALINPAMRGMVCPDFQKPAFRSPCATSWMSRSLKSWPKIDVVKFYSCAHGKYRALCDLFGLRGDADVSEGAPALNRAFAWRDTVR